MNTYLILLYDCFAVFCYIVCYISHPLSVYTPASTCDCPQETLYPLTKTLIITVFLLWYIPAYQCYIGKVVTMCRYCIINCFRDRSQTLSSNIITVHCQFSAASWAASWSLSRVYRFSLNDFHRNGSNHWCIVLKCFIGVKSSMLSPRPMSSTFNLSCSAGLRK